MQGVHIHRWLSYRTAKLPLETCEIPNLSICYIHWHDGDIAETHNNVSVFFYLDRVNFSIKVHYMYTRADSRLNVKDTFGRLKTQASVNCRDIGFFCQTKQAFSWISILQSDNIDLSLTYKVIFVKAWYWNFKQLKMYHFYCIYKTSEGKAGVKLHST